MQRYEIATLTIPFGTTARVATGVASFASAPEAHGTLLGCWFADIGPLNQIAVLRGFADSAALVAERQRTLTSSNPFGCGDVLRSFCIDSYVPFPWLPPVETGEFGPIYEIRTYGLKSGGLSPVLKAWEKALPARSLLSRLTIAMYATDGPPRFTHIWPFASTNDRAEIRAEAVRQGVWPPEGGPSWLTADMRSSIYLPTDVSPLR